MISRAPGKRKSTRLTFLVMLLVAFCLSAAYLALAERISPEQAVQRLEGANGVGDVESLQKIAARSEMLGEWAAIFAAREIEKRGDLNRALKLIAPVLKKASAARIEAELVNARLHGEAGVDSPDLPSAAELSQLSKRYRRSDLEPEVLFTIGRLAELHHDSASALKHYEELRRRFPASDFAKNARDRSRALRNVPTAQDFKLLLGEAQLLGSEGDIQAAREELASAQRLVPGGSAEFYESLFVDETLERREHKPLVADELLLKIAADGPADLAAKALFQAAKNSWNENDHLHALELLDQLGKRFPKNAQLAEAHYIEARILEELGQFAGAERAYRTIAESETDSLSRIRAAKRLSWLEYLRGNYAETRVLSERALALATSAGSAATDLSEKHELFLERISALFWKAKALHELKGPGLTTGPSAGGENPEAIGVLEEIIKLDPRGYYAVQSRLMLQQLGVHPPPFLPPRSTECEGSSEPAALRDRLKEFGSLRDLAQHEIDYFFAGLRDEGDPALALTLQSSWSGKAGLASSQIELAEEGLKQIKLGQMGTKCERTLSYLAYPVAFESLFAENAKRYRLPVTYPLAIARTESYLRADARSPVGALGLMQLMPATAKREGWDEKKELVDPSLNVALGTKYLSQLLSQFDGDLVRAAAAYNAGEAAVNRWLSRYGTYPPELFVEFIGYPETNKYVRRVVASRAVYSELLNETPKTPQPSKKAARGKL